MIQPPEAACLYQETRFGVEPASDDALVEIALPSSNASAFASAPSPKRRRIDREALGEEDFATRHLATEASIFVCQSSAGHAAKKDAHPRSILWRVCEGQRTLELQAVDLVLDAATTTEALLTLRFSFPSCIRPNTVSFADTSVSGSPWTLNVFVLTDSAELHALTLGRDAFVRSKVLSLETRPNWHSCQTPGAFTYRTPFRLIAQNESVVWAALSDGALVKLEKVHGSYEWNWRETFFTDIGWTTSLKSLMPWKAPSAILFGDTVLQSSTAISMLVAPDHKHIWTVCLDHTIKAWNISTGRLVQHMDLAGDTRRDLQKPDVAQMEPTNVQLIRAQPSAGEDAYVLVTFSPRAAAFKFWSVRDADVKNLGVEDMRPDVQFSPPVQDLLQSPIWSMVTFHVSRKRSAQSKTMDLWLLIRSGINMDIFTTTVNLDDHLDHIVQSFGRDWVRTAPSPNSTEELRDSISKPSDLDFKMSTVQPLGATEQWLHFLFCQARFSVPTLESALVIYRQSLGRAVQGGHKWPASMNRPLEERVIEIVGSKASLQSANNDTVALERYQQDIAQQWRVFYGVVKTLHQKRGTPLSLVLDIEEALPWLVMADGLSVLRSCGQIEVLWCNRATFATSEQLAADDRVLAALMEPKDTVIGQLLFAVDVFRGTCSQAFISAFSFELEHGGAADEPAAMVAQLYQNSGFAAEVSDDDYNELTNALLGLGGFAGLTTDLFQTTLELLDERQAGASQSRQLARYGARVLVSGAQDTLQLTSEILLGMLLLVVFMAAELEESDLPEGFDTNVVFDLLYGAWRRHQVLVWVASKTRLVEAASPTAVTGAMRDHHPATVADAEESQAPSLLETMFIGDWSSMMCPSGLLGDLVTYWCRVWSFGARLQDQYDAITGHVFADLLKHGETEAASDFVRFMPDTTWATYLQGRLALTKGDFSEAAGLLKDGSETLASSKHFDVDVVDSARLLSPLERESFGNGLAVYYKHVQELFAGLQGMSWSVDFAKLALSAQELGGGSDQALRSELLARWFTGALQTQRYEEALGCLCQYTDHDMQRSALHSLLSDLSAHSHVPTLLSLAFPPELTDEVDAYLAAQASQAATASLSDSPSKTVAHHRVLYSWRIGRDDYRGAASCLWERLQALRQGAEAGESEEVAELFLALLNVLALVEPDQAWILTRPPSARVTNAHQARAAGGEGRQDEVVPRAKRRIVTVEEVRALWQEELDRMADAEAGRFPVPTSFGRGMGRFGEEGAEVDVFA